MGEKYTSQLVGHKHHGHMGIGCIQELQSSPAVGKFVVWFNVGARIKEPVTKLMELNVLLYTY